jgi:hypothetical protein
MLSEIVSKYAVGWEMGMEGTRKETRFEVPTRFKTAAALTSRIEPAAGGLGVKVTVTFADAIETAGKLIPVTLTVVRPVSATPGEVPCCNVTTL